MAVIIHLAYIEPCGAELLLHICLSELALLRIRHIANVHPLKRESKNYF